MGGSSQKTIIGVLTVSAALAAVLGAMALSAGIGMLAKVSAVTQPTILTWLFGSNALAWGLGAVLFAVVPFLVAKKVTDAGMVSRYFGRMSVVLFAIAIWQGIVALAAVLRSLFSINALGGLQGLQQPIWVGAFVPAIALAVFAGVVGYVMREIAKGKTSMIGALKFAALGAGVIGFALIAIATLVSLHPSQNNNNRRTGAGSDLQQMQQMLDALGF
ncbi:hypothetical protein FWH13_02960 [Candidatus Saccharibacteria bacterium]|nr:hypothetical protein [Candidatus Saccharibacteria bacterium]